MKRFVAAFLQLAGIGAVSTAGFIFRQELGWLSVGVGLIAFGLAVERDS